MSYTIQDVQKRLSVVAENIEKYIKTNKIKVGKNGQISDKSYLTLLDLFSSQEKSENDKKNGKSDDVLSGHKIQGNSKPVFKSLDQRISLFQDDAISFLKSLPAASVDIIITDPAYSGMNQRLKLGRGKIIGKYADAGKDGAKWFEEFHDTKENYKTFLQQCYRVLRNNRHI